MGVWARYRLRLKRKALRFRAFRKRRELSAVADRTRLIAPSDTLLATVLRNERIRLPYFLRYYRDLGVKHFLIIDNGSDDGSRDYLAAQKDVSLWATTASYRAARYGVDWINWLLMRHAIRHWILTVDVDEFFVYPFCDTRPIRALTDWLDIYGLRSLSGDGAGHVSQGPDRRRTLPRRPEPVRDRAVFRQRQLHDLAATGPSATSGSRVGHGRG